MHRARKQTGGLPKLWLNWPLALGLVANFVIIGLVVGCLIHG